jgi:hypothetical protein
VYDATTDLDQIRGWWQDMPDANLAIRTGLGLAVLDFDSALTPGVERLLRELRVPVVQTVRGIHAYFACDDLTKTSRIELEGGISFELRAEDVYVVAPPSVHSSGRLYVPASPPLELRGR